MHSINNTLWVKNPKRFFLNFLKCLYFRKIRAISIYFSKSPIMGQFSSIVSQKNNAMCISKWAYYNIGAIIFHFRYLKIFTAYGLIDWNKFYLAEH